MTIKELAEKYNRPESEFQFRADGRIEWVCKHRVGHTVYAPRIEGQSEEDHEWNYVHGCDGCCSKMKKGELDY